jgi:S1-C subfamily serine protease
MRKELLALVLLTGFASVGAAAQSPPLKTIPSAKSAPTYKITAHTVAHDDNTNSQLDNYIIVYGSEVLKVQYAESQISTLKPGASRLEQLAPGKDLHLHFRYGVWPKEPDVSQVPQVGVSIRACEMDTKYPDKDGHPVIGIQSVSAPCMSRNGDTLHYVLAPNGGVKMWEYVNFDILEATNSVGVAAAQSAPPRKDIPSIAKAANGAIVTIVTANNDDPIALGSGFLVSSDGAIATNYHVIASGNVAVVKFADGTVLPVDGVLATDKVHDLAIIKIHGKTFQTLTLGNSDQIQVGEEVVAIGNPLGLELTVSNGILSGVRITKEEDKFLQTTAPISHGSSGGPLFNMLGEVVGVNALYLEGGASLNFAIPVNDVKNLLHNQFAQLQQLPNEPNTDKPETSSPKPDAPTALPSDAASPRENELGIDTPSHKTPSYYIRAYQRGAYIIEYNGRQLAATCRETLTWLDGMDKPGRLMGEHDCTYMPSLVGKQIRPELMWHHDKELRYQPWLGDDTVQTADILDITAEAPVGALLRRSSPKTSPEILKTLRWIQNTLDDDEGNTVYGMSNKDGTLGTRVNLLPDVNGCQVTFAHATRGDEEKETYHQRLQVNLGDLAWIIHDFAGEKRKDALKG